MTISPRQVIWARFLVILAVSTVLCISKGEPFFQKITARWEIVFRCVFGIISFLCSTYAIQHLPGKQFYILYHDVYYFGDVYEMF